MRMSPATCSDGDMHLCPSPSTLVTLPNFNFRPAAYGSIVRPNVATALEAAPLGLSI